MSNPKVEDEAGAMLAIFRLARSTAGTGTAVKVFLDYGANPPVTEGKKAEGYIRNGRWVDTQPSTYKIYVGVDWPPIAHYFLKFPKLQSMMNFREGVQPPTPPPKTEAGIERALRI